MVATTRAALARQLQSSNTTRTIVSSAIRKKYTQKKKIIVKQPTSSSTTSPPLAPYNEVAGKSNITDACVYDHYGNPTGREYDLGRDGAFMGFNILIAQFYSDSQFNDAAMQKPIAELKSKGFQVILVKTEDECITELASNRYQIAWIISTSQIQKGYRNFANKTFANRTSAIGESPLYFRQYTPWSFANWRKSTVLSPTHPLEFRQLANVHCTFANIFPGISPI